MSENDRQLSHSEYWDSRYVVSDGENPTHEWFRSFQTLQPFFQKNLFDVRDPATGADPYILHLGSGDSVSDCKIILSLNRCADALCRTYQLG